MATRIIEYRNIGSPGAPNTPIPSVPGNHVQAAMTATGTSAQSPVFKDGTAYIEIDTDETIHVAISADPTATTDYRKVRAGNYQFFGVRPGHRVAIITGT